MAIFEMSETDGPPNLENIPTEIRQMIYEEVFRNLQLTIRIPASHIRQCDSDFIGSQELDRPPKGPCRGLSLLGVNKKVQHEARGVMLRQTTFVHDLHINTRLHPPWFFHDFFTALQLRSRTKSPAPSLSGFSLVDDIERLQFAVMPCYMGGEREVVDVTCELRKRGSLRRFRKLDVITFEVASGDKDYALRRFGIKKNIYG